MEYPNLNEMSNSTEKNRTERSEKKTREMAFMWAVRETLGQKEKELPG